MPCIYGNELDQQYIPIVSVIVNKPGFLHGDNNNPVIFLGMVAQNGDKKVSVERVQTPRWLVQQQHHYKTYYV